MPSSKGKPTDPKLREEIKEDIKNEGNKDGGGQGQWSAWKAAKLSKEYEKQGGDYENEAGSKNEPKKGAPEAKSGDKKDEEVKDTDANGDAEPSKEAPKEKKGAKKADKKGAEEKKDEPKEKSEPKKAKVPKAKKQKKEPAQGTRRSERVSKREAETTDDASSKKQKK